jgi:FtsZ-binding cell division protein ZapB
MVWYFIALELSDRDPIKILNIYNMKLQDVLDYITILKLNNEVEELKKSKNILPI